MKLAKEVQWFCENSQALEKYAGQWVLFYPDQGIVGSAYSFKKAVAKANKHKARVHPFVFHVPTSSELCSPLPTLRHVR